MSLTGTLPNVKAPVMKAPTFKTVSFKAPSMKMSVPKVNSKLSIPVVRPASIKTGKAGMP